MARLGGRLANRFGRGLLLVGLCSLGRVAPAQAAWAEVTTLTHPTAAPGDKTWFGQSVACSGKRILVGAGWEDNFGGAVYALSGDDFKTVDRMAPPMGAAEDFGTQLSLSGDTAGIATIDIDGGDAHFFRLGGAGWALETSITPTIAMPAYSGSFGRPMIVRGDWAAVGSPKENGDTGRVYIYKRAAGVWTEHAQLAASDERMGNFFGLPLAFDGDTAVVGAGRNAGDADQYNAVYVFERSGDGWTQQARLDISDQSVRDPDIRFGIAVALAGDTLAVGAPDKANDGVFQGRVFVYDRAGGAWSLSDVLQAESGQEYFGGTLAAEPDTLIVTGLEGAATNVYTYRKLGGAWTKSSTLASKQGEDDIALCGALMVRGGDEFATVYRDAELEGTDPTLGPSSESGSGGGSGGSSASNPSGSAGVGTAGAAMPGNASSKDEGGCSFAPNRAGTASALLLFGPLLIASVLVRRRRRRGDVGRPSAWVGEQACGFRRAPCKGAACLYVVTRSLDRI